MRNTHRGGIRTMAVLGAVVSLITVNAGAASAGDGRGDGKGEGDHRKKVALSGVQEVPSNSSEAEGRFRYEIDGSEFCYRLKVKDLTTPATVAHVHLAPRGTVGPPVIDLRVEAETKFQVRECVTVDKDLLAQVTASPEDFYVNVHTATYPGGEIRGQLQ